MIKRYSLRSEFYRAQRTICVRRSCCLVSICDFSQVHDECVLIFRDSFVFRRQQLEQSVYCESEPRRATANVEDDRQDVQSASPEKIKVRYQTFAHLFGKERERKRKEFLVETE